MFLDGAAIIAPPEDLVVVVPLPFPLEGVPPPPSVVPHANYGHMCHYIGVHRNHY